MKFGLIGYPLGHSFSRDYFTEKFRLLGLSDFSYDLFPVKHKDEVYGILRSTLFGLNVTIPLKEVILEYLNDIDPVALKIGAVNTLVRTGQYSWKGFNSDAVGFELSLLDWIGDHALPARALILGSGGASRAVSFVLKKLGIDPYIVSRAEGGDFRYEELTQEVMSKHLLIVNTTPLGMEPDVLLYPGIPYEYLTSRHWMYDLIYNPANTLFLQRSQQMGAKTKNGLQMLHIQADEAWSIWKSYGRF